MSPATLPVLTVGDSYSQQLTASGGSGTGYSFTATGVPAGLTLAAPAPERHAHRRRLVHDGRDGDRQHRRDRQPVVLDHC